MLYGPEKPVKEYPWNRQQKFHCIYTSCTLIPQVRGLVYSTAGTPLLRWLFLLLALEWRKPALSGEGHVISQILIFDSNIYVCVFLCGAPTPTRYLSKGTTSTYWAIFIYGKKRSLEHGPGAEYFSFSLNFSFSFRVSSDCEISHAIGLRVKNKCIKRINKSRKLTIFGQSGCHIISSMTFWIYYRDKNNVWDKNHD